MNFQPALQLAILHYLFDQAWQKSRMPVKKAECKVKGSGERLCPELFSLTKKNGYPVCYLRGNAAKEKYDAEEAERECEAQQAHLPRLDKETEYNHPGKEMLDALNNTSFWLAASTNDQIYRNDSLGPQCYALGKDGREEHMCTNKSLSLMCEVELAGEKPVVSVTNYGQSERQQQELVLYEDSRVTVGCSVIRAKESVIHIHVKSDNNNTWLFYAKNLITSTSDTECGVRTVAYLEGDLRVHTVTCVLERFHGPECAKENPDCSAMGPFTYSSDFIRPKISVEFHTPPNLVSDQQSIKAKCSDRITSDSAIRWLVVKGMEQYLLHNGEPGVQITDKLKKSSKVTTSSLTFDLRDRCWGESELDLICYTTHDPPMVCEEDNFFCNTVDIHVEPQGKPYVHVSNRILKDKKLLFEESTVTITCSFVRSSPQDMIIQVSDLPNSNSRLFTRENFHIKTEKIKCGVRSSASIQVYLDKDSETVEAFLVTCTMGNSSIDPCYPEDPDCGTDGPLRYFKIPGEVEINVQFSRPPDIVTDGTPIVANCTSHNFAPVWAMTVQSKNQEFSILKTDDPGVDIEETLDGNMWRSELTLTTFGRGWATHIVNLMCYNGDLYDEETGCLKDYLWCREALIYIEPMSEDLMSYYVAFSVVFACLGILGIIFLIFVFTMESSGTNVGKAGIGVSQNMAEKQKSAEPMKKLVKKESKVSMVQDKLRRSMKMAKKEDSLSSVPKTKKEDSGVTTIKSEITTSGTTAIY